MSNRHSSSRSTIHTSTEARSATSHRSPGQPAGPHLHSRHDEPKPLYSAANLAGAAIGQSPDLLLAYELIQDGKPLPSIQERTISIEEESKVAHRLGLLRSKTADKYARAGHRAEGPARSPEGGLNQEAGYPLLRARGHEEYRRGGRQVRPRVHAKRGDPRPELDYRFGAAEISWYSAPMTAHTHHTIDYIEFSVTNMDEAQRFYGAAFGWTFNDYGPGYAGIVRGDGEAGGMAVVDAVVTGGPLVVLYSSDLESTLAKVIEAGGRISKEIFDFPGGRRFQFVDPSGNELAAWTLAG